MKRFIGLFLLIASCACGGNTGATCSTNDECSSKNCVSVECLQSGSFKSVCSADSLCSVGGSDCGSKEQCVGDVSATLGHCIPLKVCD